MQGSGQIKTVFKQASPLIKNSLLPFLEGKISSSSQDQQIASYFNNAEVPELINQRMTFAEADNFVNKAHLFTRHIIVEYNDPKNISRKVKVYGAPIKLGLTTCEPIKRNIFTLELDLADCRVKFKINHRMRRYVHKILKRVTR